MYLASRSYFPLSLLLNYCFCDIVVAWSSQSIPTTEVVGIADHLTTYFLSDGLVSTEFPTHCTAATAELTPYANLNGNCPNTGSLERRATSASSIQPQIMSSTKNRILARTKTENAKSSDTTALSPRSIRTIVLTETYFAPLASSSVVPVIANTSRIAKTSPSTVSRSPENSHVIPPSKYGSGNWSTSQCSVALTGNTGYSNLQMWTQADAAGAWDYVANLPYDGSIDWSSFVARELNFSSWQEYQCQELSNNNDCMYQEDCASPITPGAWMVVNSIANIWGV